MAAPTQTDEMEKLAKAEATLVEKVAYPAFFEKLAAAGLTPVDQKVAHELIGLSDVVVPAVGRAVERYLSRQNAEQLAAVKAAADVARAVTGPAATPAPAVATADFLTDPDVKAAADLLAAAQLKRANLANLVAPAKTEEEEEETKAPGAKS